MQLVSNGIQSLDVFLHFTLYCFLHGIYKSKVYIVEVLTLIYFRLFLFFPGFI